MSKTLQDIPAGMDLRKRTMTYEDYLIACRKDSEYNRTVARRIEAKRNRRGY